jgi:hypothetical protein
MLFYTVNISIILMDMAPRSCYKTVYKFQNDQIRLNQGFIAYIFRSITCHVKNKLSKRHESLIYMALNLSALLPLHAMIIIKRRIDTRQ